MKNIFIWILILATLNGYSQKVTIGEMNQWLQQRDFFSLKKALSVRQPDLTTQDSLYFIASVQNAFGENSASIQTIGKLSDHFATQLDEGSWINLLNILADNYIKNFDYKSAAASYAILINKYSRVLSRDNLEGYQNSYMLYHALENISPQYAELSKIFPVQMQQDQVGLWNVPVTFNQQDTANFVFDSGAGLSTITRSAANKLGLTIISTNINVNSANEKQVGAQLGIAKELTISGAIFHNVIFLVMDDASLSFPSIQYQIQGIIGFPVINALHSITIHKSGLLEINTSKSIQQTTNPNFFYQGNAIRMQGISGEDTLLFHLDTGAKQSELGKTFYQTHKSLVKALSEKKKYHLAGAGGVTAYKAYQMSNYSLQIGNTKGTLDYIPVYPDKVSEYVNAIGQDYIQLFNAMHIDFDHCQISFQN